MKISVSQHNCHPLRKAVRADGGKCSGCGIEVPSGLEWHNLAVPKGQAARRLKLCPLCHCSQHLDTAGILEAGTMIWLPEFEQQHLNLLCHIIFAALRERKTGGIDDQSPQGLQIERLRNLYQSFMARSAGVISLFGGRNSSINAASPALIAQHFRRVVDGKKITAAELGKKLDGLRYLPTPKAFEAFNIISAKAILAKHPLATWAALIPSPEAALQPVVPRDDDEHGEETRPGAYQHADLGSHDNDQDQHQHQDQDQDDEASHVLEHGPDNLGGQRFDASPLDSDEQDEPLPHAEESGQYHSQDSEAPPRFNDEEATEASQ